MGREIRRVCENWEHPKDSQGRYMPLYEGYANALSEFEEIYQEEGLQEAIEYMGAPNKHDYVPDWDKAEWYQVYETVSEGTPVTPPFETKAELVDYLVENGTFWNSEGYAREAAEKFVDAGWVPSMIMTGGQMLRDINCATEFKKGE